jgi:hypothetical protein
MGNYVCAGAEGTFSEMLLGELELLTSAKELGYAGDEC